MKFIPSMAHQLSKAEDRVESLTKSNCELQEEIGRLRLRLARATIVQPQKSPVGPSGSPKVTRSSTSEETTPSYARTTKAFRLRSSPSCPQQVIAKPSKLPLPGHSSPSEETTASQARLTESARLRSSSSSLGHTSSASPVIDSSPTMTPNTTRLSIHGKDYTNEDGKLNGIKPEDFIIAAFRIRYEISQIPGALDPLASTWISSYFLQHIYNTGCAKTLNTVQKPKQPKTPKLKSKIKESDDQLFQEGIASRTRLADKAWINSLYFKVYINHDCLSQILFEGQESAKECVWTWIRVYRPQYLSWLGYLADVDFSGSKFYGFIERMPAAFFSFRHSKSRDVKRRLYQLTGLRNLMCHFNGLQDVRQMDVYLENIHALAVLFYDEPRAALARALRDRLRAEAQRTLQEIETLTILTTLPDAGDPWLLHHRNTVCDAVDELDRGYLQPWQRHPILVTAAREWVAHRARWPSHHLGWEYGTSIPIPEVEENTATKGRSLDKPNLLNAAVNERRTKLLWEENNPDGDVIIADDLMLEEGEISQGQGVLEWARV